MNLDLMNNLAFIFGANIFFIAGGPSDQKLFPGDEILAVNSEDVSEAEKDHVVQLVR